MCKICDKGTQQISSVEFEGYTARVRLDLDANQIDCQLVRIDKDGTYGEWSTDCLDINYCPVCGKKLDEPI